MKRGEERKVPDDRSGAVVCFPYDRAMVDKFRKSFPRARWSDEKNAWLVPGVTAARRYQRWLEREFGEVNAYADQRGRDAAAFDPITSKYLVLADEGLEVRTPYSRTIIEELREIPFAAWNSDRRVWTLPYASYEALRRRWGQIEAAASRNEPDMRRKRRAEIKGSAEARAASARVTERRRRRYPLDPDDLPPFGRPVATTEYGIVVFVGCDGELVDSQILRSSYARVPFGDRYVWGHWRPAQLEELIKAWPSRSGAASRPSGAVWWRPSIDELRSARKAARALARRRGSGLPAIGRSATHRE